MAGLDPANQYSPLQRTQRIYWLAMLAGWMAGSAAGHDEWDIFSTRFTPGFCPRRAPGISRAMPDYAAQRINMIENQVRPADVTDLAVQAAMGEVPREHFVPASKRELAYMDGCVEVARGRFLLDARSFAKLLQLADVQPTDTVLDVGCATGYSTAVLSRLAARVIGLEEDAELVRAASEALAGLGNVEVVQGRLADGLPTRAPFDVIFVNGGVEVTPERLLAQLGEDGRLVCAIRQGAAGYGRIYVKHDGAIGDRDAFNAVLPVLPGFAKRAGFVF
jgi:protein-L-isoaspartate(D-aspartate) O-methyltransferase